MILLVAAALRIVRLHELPPGPHYDEAVEILITRSIAFNGANFFPIVNSYQGREALFYYLSAPLFQTIHDGVFSLRLANVFCSLLTIAAAAALGRAMFKGTRGVVVGLVIGVCLALSFPQIWLARQAFRTGPQPMLQALSLLFLWRGLNTRRHAALLLAIGGIFAGAALYTYMASRLFPLWLLMGGAALLFLDSANRRQRFQQGLIFFGALGLTALPMALYALQNPDIFFRRLAEVTTTGEVVSLGESIRRHILMFFIQGEAYLRYNIPGRPYMTWPEGLLLAGGLALAFWRLLRPGRPTERAAYALALLAPLMVIPSVISVGGLPPNHMRAVGMIPLIFVPVGIACDALLRRVKRQQAFLATITPVALLAGGLAVANLYFDWARRADLFYEADADLALAARWLDSQAAQNTRVYVASRHVEHPTISALWSQPVTWMGTDSVFSPPPDQTGLLIFAHNEPPAPAWAPLLAPYALADVPAGPDDQPAFWAYRLPAGAPLAAALVPRAGVQNGYMTLLGVNAPPTAAGDSAAVVIGWRFDQPMPFNDFTPILQLEDGQGTVLARAEGYLVGTGRWLPGETMLHQLTAPVPPATPPGDYLLRLTWVGRDSGTYVAFKDSAGAQSGVWETIGTLTVTRPSTFPDSQSLAIPHRVDINAVPGVQFLGWDMPLNTHRPGETLALRLFWQATAIPPADFTVRALLRGSQGDTLLFEGPPAAGYPASLWQAGEVLNVPVYWAIPRQHLPDTYRLLLQLGPDHREVDLGAVQVAGLPRVWQAPPVEQRLDAAVGDTLALYGYNIIVDNEIELTFVWYCKSETQQDYTVFVHFVDDTGAIVRQQDTMPQHGAYPTSLWAAGEYVTDSYRFNALPPGRYHIRVGLYLQATGQRLTINNKSDYIEISTIENEARP